MGIYRDQLLPRAQDRFMAREPNRELRRRVCEGLNGVVVEIGFGTGLNVRYYPSEVTKVVAVEPSALCMRLASSRIEKSTVPIEHGGLNGERLDLPSGTADTVLSTWTLCTIPDLAGALGEVHRVLKPGGLFHFVEHGHSPHPKVAGWQRRLEPFNKRFAGGCHLTRRISDEIVAAGFEIEHLDAFYAEGEPKSMGYTFLGRSLRR